MPVSQGFSQEKDKIYGDFLQIRAIMEETGSVYYCFDERRSGMIYCMGDIHGNYEGYCELLQKMRFSDRDTLYTIGDIVDRGQEGMKVLLDMMMRPNVFPILGNHDYMAYNCLQWLSEEITEESIRQLEGEKLHAISEWIENGGGDTITEFRRLTKEERELVLEYFGEFAFYEEVEAGGKSFVLVHGGLPDFSPEKPLEDYEPAEMIWDRCDYSKTYFPDKYLVTGHTPTRNIRDSLGQPLSDKILMCNHHIAIDCGSGHGGLLGAVCLDNLKEFYA